MAALGRVRLSPWLIVLAALNYLLGDGVFLWVSLACVFLHELGHALCAAACGAVVESIEIAPFGGVARIRGLEQMSPWRAVLVALAGPAVNMLLAVCCGCAAYLAPETAEICAKGMSVNLTLAMFNLLPAYPLDGGRVLCAALQGRMGLVRAQRITAGVGLVLGLALLLMGIAAVRFAGKVNLTLLICGGYVCAAACRARRETPYSYMQMLLGRERELERRCMLPVRTIAVKQGMTDAEVAAKLQPGAYYRVIYLDDRMRVAEEKWESAYRG